MEPTANEPMPILPEHTAHPRMYQRNRYVYPVLSRRSGGISIGVNLNPDKVCNFDCIYCQVDRTTPAEIKDVDVDAVQEELAGTVDLVTGGGLFEDERFRDVPAKLRVLKDIAFSGDGEPTTAREFESIVRRVAELKRRRGLDGVKLVLITNATRFHRPGVASGLEILMANEGEIWAKLDAGTQEYYDRVERTPIPLDQVLTNLRKTAQTFPLVIQSLFMRIEGEGPSATEIDAYIDRLEEILDAGGRLKGVQVYTIARPPAESCVTALSGPEIDAIANRVKIRLPVPVEVFYGTTEFS